MKNLIFLLFFVFIIPVHLIRAQEIVATVTVNKERISRTGIDHVNDLAKQIENYINDFKWTDLQVLEQERLTCNIQINLNEVTDNLQFSASIVVQLFRPIYGTVQNTSTLTLLDNTWSFSYPPNRVFIHDEFQFDDIASLLDFYMFLILGYDGDTFANLGGTKYLNKANAVHDLANTANSPGWNRSTRQGRAVLIQSLTSPNYESLRSAMYTYHRLGLDLFTQNPELARKNILGALEKIRENRKVITEIYPFDLFFNTKYRELTSLFMDADPAQKVNVYSLLVEVDPSHITKYDELNQ